MIAAGVLAIVFMTIGVVCAVFLAADLIFGLGRWRRDRIRQSAKIKQPGKPSW